MIDFEKFESSLTSQNPPHGLSDALQALWFDANGKWDWAHELVQDGSRAEDAWVHAYLHRKEGDASNARYWYSRAGKAVCSASLEHEWNEIVSALLRK